MSDLLPKSKDYEKENNLNKVTYPAKNIHRFTIATKSTTPIS